MAVKTRPSARESVGTVVLEQLAELDVQSISPAMAHKLLQFKVDPCHQERLSLLSEKAQRGTLSPIEGDELDEYIRVGTLLGILQSRARQVLKNSGESS